jgi:hypothetical protein
VEKSTREQTGDCKSGAALPSNEAAAFHHNLSFYLAAIRLEPAQKGFALQPPVESRRFRACKLSAREETAMVTAPTRGDLL